MSVIQGVLFDKDGTLFDFRATWGAWTRAFLTDLAGGDAVRLDAMSLALGYDYADQSFSSDSIVIAGTPGEIAEAILPMMPGTTPAALLTRMNVSAASAPQIEAAPLQPMLRDLIAMGLRIGVATNDAEMPARAHLAAAGVASLFDFVVGFDSGFGSKPAAGQLVAFADKFDLAPESVVMVGDSRHDLRAGRAAGMKTLAVRTGLEPEGDLAALADAVLDHVGQVPEWISAHSAGLRTKSAGSSPQSAA